MNERGPSNVVREYGHFRIRILAVIVLFKVKASDSSAYQTLRNAISHLSKCQIDIQIVLFDNTPGGQDTEVLPPDVEYKADIRNGGLAEAYNYAAERAYTEKRGWLLTLDQDTSLPVEFLQKLCDHLARVDSSSNVGAIIPFVANEGQVISPFMPGRYWIHMNTFPDKFVGLAAAETYAVNSGSLIRISALREIGGYDPRFHLYASDLAMYRRLWCHDIQTFIAGDICIDHEMSGMSLSSQPESICRFEEALRAEEAFCDEYLGTVSRIVMMLKIVYRMSYVLWRIGGGFPHFRISLRFLFRRMFYSRTHRLRNWQDSVRQNMSGNSHPHSNAMP